LDIKYVALLVFIQDERIEGYKRSNKAKVETDYGGNGCGYEL
jgi:hypothetical protein